MPTANPRDRPATKTSTELVLSCWMYVAPFNFEALGTFPRAQHFQILDFAETEERSMATQIVMDHSGDTRHVFDASDAKALQEAERRFKELTGSGFTAAIRTDS